MKNTTTTILVITSLFLVSAAVFNNYREELSIDESKIPSKVEESSGFQRWITNLKKKDFDIEGDEFRLVEENEIYNTKWISVYSIDDEDIKKEFEETIAAHKSIKKVVFSPSGRQFIDYRPEIRGKYNPNEARYYGLRDDKLIDARILDCSVRANCYFDRAYFLDNESFVISEISRNIDEQNFSDSCNSNQTCSYTFKVHVIDLINNSRLIYESRPFEAVLNDVIPNL